MVPTSSVELSDGVYHLDGCISEKTNLDLILDATTFPIQLNVRDVDAMSNVGVGKLMALVQTIGAGKVEFHECPPLFIAAINTLPKMRKHPERVKSCYLPHICDSCKSVQNVLVQLQDVRYKNEKISLPRQACTDCLAVLRPNVELEDYFLFLTEGHRSTARKPHS